MPIIEMHLMQGRTVEQKRAVAEAIAEAVTRTLGVRPEQIRLLITEHSSEEFSVGGITAGRKQELAEAAAQSASPDGTVVPIGAKS